MGFDFDLDEELKPQFECKRNFGEEQFTFYTPLSVGDFTGEK